MPDASAHRFGRGQPMALPDVPLDVAFLSSAGDSNGAAILAAHIEDALVGGAEDSPSDSMDRFLLRSSLTARWKALKGESALLPYVAALESLAHDPSRLELWQQAAGTTTQGARVHATEPAKALELYTAALGAFEALGDEKGAGRCRGNIGLLMLQHDRLPDAVQQCLAALELHRGVGYGRGCLMHLHNLAFIARQQQRWDEALEVAQQYRALMERVDATLLASAHAAVGQCAWQRSDQPLAMASYAQAVDALSYVQTPATLASQLRAIGPLAQAVGRADELQVLATSLQQQVADGLQVLAIRPLAPGTAILNRFREASATGDPQALFESLAASRAWSSFVFQRLLAEHALAALLGDAGDEQDRGRTARRFALVYCRSFLDRGPFDEHALYTTWTLDQRIAKAKAYALEAAAIGQASSGDEVDAALTRAFALHQLVGDLQAHGLRFPEILREVRVPQSSRSRMHALMMQAAHAAYSSRPADEHAALSELLQLATEQGTTLNVADAHVRLGIHHAQGGDVEQAASHYAEAERQFASLERIGTSVVEETGRSHNRLKFAAHLVDFLDRTGRYHDVPYVAVPALRELAWFTESFDHAEYSRRALDYKTRLLYALTRAYERLGSYEKALTYAQELADWSDQIGDSSGRAAAEQAKAAALRAMNRPQEALACAEADLAIQLERGDIREIVVALAFCAALYLETGDVERAREAATKVLEGAQGLSGAAQAARDARYVLAQIAARSQPDEAARLYSEILAEEEQLPGPGWITTAAALAQHLLSCGRTADATRAAERAWLAAADASSLPLRVSAGCVYARCQLATGRGADVRSAIDVLLECGRLTEMIRGEITKELDKTSIAVAQTEPFELLLSVLASVTEVDPDPQWRRLAFDVAERAKARALTESLAASAAREAEKHAVRFTGLTMRLVDAREEVAAAGFDQVRDMLNREQAQAT